MTSSHEIDAESLAKRLRAKNASTSITAAKRFTSILKKSAKLNSRPRVRSRGASRNVGSWKKRGFTPATILKIHKGGLAGDAYSESAKKSRLIDTNMIGRTAKERLKEWRLDQLRHPIVKNLLVHISISRPEGLNMSDENWAGLVKAYLKSIGAERVNYQATLHNDTKKQHVHVIFSRALPNGNLLSDSNNYYRWREGLRSAEKAVGLKSIEIESGSHKETRAMTASDAQWAAIKRANRTGEKPNNIDPNTIKEVLLRSKTTQDFEFGLSQIDIQIDIAKNKDGSDKGILYKLAESNEWLAGSSIDRGLSLRYVIQQIKQNTETSTTQKTINGSRARQVNQHTQRPQGPIYTREHG